MEKHCLANLRGLIVSKYKNYSRYAEALGWSRQKLSYKLFQSTQPRGLRRQMFTENRRDGTRFYDNLMNLCLEIILRHQK